MTKIVGRTKENVASLPTWARRRIERLEHEVAKMKADVEAASTPGSTPVTLLGVANQTERGLPPDARVRFRVDASLSERFSIEVSIRDRMLEVRALDGFLTILPAVSNVVHIKASHR